MLKPPSKAAPPPLMFLTKPRQVTDNPTDLLQVSRAWIQGCRTLCRTLADASFKTAARMPLSACVCQPVGFRNAAPCNASLSLDQTLRHAVAPDGLCVRI